jgi:RNA polymerase sigma factor (sigma-70 family)
MPDVTDMDLVQEFAERNSESAFAELVRRHINLAYSVALRFTANSPDAQDVTQAVFIILAKKAGALRGRTVLTGWIYETTRLTALQFLRTRARRYQHEQEAHMQSTVENQTADEIWPQMGPLLEQAMSRLNEKERTLLALRYFENRTSEETASLLGIGEWAARKRSARALEKLRKYFSKHGVNSTTAIIAASISANSLQLAPMALAKSVTALAVAKGAAASASTVTLIKGALKIMAWTKMKTAVVTSAAIVLATFTAVVTTNYVRGAAPSLKLPTGQVNPMIIYGYSHNVVVLAPNGSLWSWGEERLGWPVLGLGTNIQNTTALRRIGTDTDWVSVAVGDSHCLAIKSDGSLWAWGANFENQLGDGTKTTRPTPIPSIPGNDWKQAAAGGESSFAIKNDGTLWAWGRGYLGLGNGNRDASAQGTQVGNSTNWKKIWTGGIQTVGLQSDGSLWFWGSLTGDSSDNKNIFVSPTLVSPDTNWVDVCFGYFTILAIKSDGTLWSWGREANFYTLADASSNSIPMQVGTDNDWESCSSAPGCLYHLFRKKDGTLWALDASEHRRVKPDNSYAPLTFQKIDWQKGIAAYAAGGDDIGVILTPNGEIWTWGRAIGEYSLKDYFGPDGKSSLEPKPTIINKPWQLTNFDAAM